MLGERSIDVYKARLTCWKDMISCIEIETFSKYKLQQFGNAEGAHRRAEADATLVVEDRTEERTAEGSKTIYCVLSGM